MPHIDTALALPAGMPASNPSAGAFHRRASLPEVMACYATLRADTARKTLPLQADEFDALFRQRLQRLQQRGGVGHAVGTRFIGEGAKGKPLSLPCVHEITVSMQRKQHPGASASVRSCHPWIPCLVFTYRMLCSHMSSNTGRSWRRSILRLHPCKGMCAFVSSCVGIADCCLTMLEALAVHSIGADVASLQRFLVGEARLPPAAVTGTFDGATRAALAEWQADVGVPVTGYFGDASRLAYLQGQVCVPWLVG